MIGEKASHLPRMELYFLNSIHRRQMEDWMVARPEYTLDEFQKTYAMEKREAERIFNVSGPSRINLDIFMKVYRKPNMAEQLFVEDIGRDR